jgi:hypothetical protein
MLPDGRVTPRGHHPESAWLEASRVSSRARRRAAPLPLARLAAALLFGSLLVVIVHMATAPARPGAPDAPPAKRAHASGLPR